MPESHDRQNESEGDECRPRSQSEYHQSARDEFDERDDDASRPERPDGQEGVGEGQKELAGVLDRPQLKDLPDARHEEDQSEHETREEQRPTAINSMTFNYFHSTVRA